MRIKADGTKTGGFYVPVGYHLRVQLADQETGGWFSTQAWCLDKACFDSGKSLWFTGADQYNYPDRDPLLLVEPNVNAWDYKNDPSGFSKGTIWFDLSAVDGINSNIQLIYGKINRKITVPLFESDDITKMDESYENFEKIGQKEKQFLKK